MLCTLIGRYLYIRGLHDREDVLQARLAVLRHVRDGGEGRLDADSALEEGVLDHRCGQGCVPFMEVGCLGDWHLSQTKPLSCPSETSVVRPVFIRQCPGPFAYLLVDWVYVGQMSCDTQRPPTVQIVWNM
jgi:hypothetical protein